MIDEKEKKPADPRSVMIFIFLLALMAVAFFAVLTPIPQYVPLALFVLKGPIEVALILAGLAIWEPLFLKGIAVVTAIVLTVASVTAIFSAHPFSMYAWGWIAFLVVIGIVYITAQNQRLKAEDDSYRATLTAWFLLALVSIVVGGSVAVDAGISLFIGLPATYFLLKLIGKRAKAAAEERMNKK